MTQLEDKLSDGFYVSVNPNGINYSHFDKDKFRESVMNGLWESQAQFGVLLEDEDGKKTELFGVFRDFRKRPALTRPISLPIEHLHDEQITFSSELFGQLGTFFRGLGEIDPPTRERTTYWESDFKKVSVTRIMPEKQWWKGMFIDLYVESEGVIERLSPMDQRSRKVLEESEKWRRYERVRRYIRTLQEESGRFLNGDSEFGKGEVLGFLLRHASVVRPALFRNGVDYLYFLLGFSHAGLDVEEIHKSVLTYFKDQRTLEGYVEQFNTAVKRLNISPGYGGIQIARPYRVFGEDVSEEELHGAYERVRKNGIRIRCPITISEDLWDLGFLTLKRNGWRETQPTKASYALVKIKGRTPALQGNLPFPGRDQSAELEREDYSPRKTPPPLEWL